MIRLIFIVDCHPYPLHLSGTKRLLPIVVHPGFLDALECHPVKEELQRVTGDGFIVDDEDVVRTVAINFLCQIMQMSTI